MKFITAFILVCTTLILTGCRTNQGGTADEYDYNYDTGNSTPPTSSPKGATILTPGGTAREAMPPNTPP